MPNPDILLIIYGNKIGQDVQKAKWFKSFEAEGIYIPCFPVEGIHFSRWLQQRCQQYHLNITPDALKLLADYSEGNLLAAAQEIEKLNLLGLNGLVDESQLESVMLDQSRFNVFQLTDLLLKGQSEKALTVLSRLKAEDIEPNIILWAMEKEIALLDKLHEQMATGVSKAEAYKQNAIWKSRMPLFDEALARLSKEQVEKLVIAISKLEVKLKSFTLPHPFTEFAQICLQMTKPNVTNKVFG